MRVSTLLVLGFGAAIVAACGGGVSLGDLGNGADGGGADGGGDGAPIECASKEACGPAPKSLAIMCPDGSIGGNTGRCLKTSSGCAWEQRECPPVACFDAQGVLSPSLKKCTATTDCVAVVYQLDCCGSRKATGVNLSSEAAVAKCAQDRAAGFPACGCPSGPTVADDGSKDPGGGATPSVTCNGAGQCETSFGVGPTCGATTCKPGGTCCSGVPFPEPTCIDTGACPISQRKLKKDITYLSLADRERLNDELQRFPLATYRYKAESDTDRAHLGFIIDDVAPSPAVLPSGERVDLYGYQTMTVAALQVQARELAALRREMDELKAACGKKR
jgi:hypothetical protein